MQNDNQQTILEKAIGIVRQASSGFPYHTQAALARATGESEANISRWLNGSATPTLKRLEPILTLLGVRLQLPTDEPKEATLMISQAGAGQTTGLAQESFMAIPLVGEVGAGGGIVPQEYAPPEWFVAPQDSATRAMWAMRVAGIERSMLPTIYPKDVVIIDKNTITTPKSEHIYLVQEPPCVGSSYLLKRVKLATIGKNPVIIFYSDNTHEGYAPIVYELSQYPDSSITFAIKGTVVKIWADLQAR